MNKNHHPKNQTGKWNFCKYHCDCTSFSMVVASNRINLWRACRAALRTWTFSSRARRCSMDITPCLSGKPAAEACVESVSYSVESVSYNCNRLVWSWSVTVRSWSVTAWSQSVTVWIWSVAMAIGLRGIGQLECGVGQLQCGVSQL